MRHFDLCVLGSGPAGQNAAIQAAKLGKAVCVVEAREVVGGSAIHTGTIPSKALREAILALTGRAFAMPTLADFSAAKKHSIHDLWQSCQDVLKAETTMVRGHLASNGIELCVGKAQFRDAKTIDVTGEHASTAVSADHVVIATGSYPTRPSSIDFDKTDIITSDELLDLKAMPRSMIIVGGGVIGTEYASMLAALGVKITIIEGRGRLLDFVDAEITEALQYHLRQAGTTLRLGEKVVKINKLPAPEGVRSDNKIIAEAVLESGKTLRADCLLYCIGRQGSTDKLNLQMAGLSADDRGRIKVNEHYQPAAPHIYAVGDVIGFPSLASTSMEQGRHAACHAFGVPCTTVPELLPYGIFSIPEISMVGWTEEKLTAEGVPYEA